MSIHWRRALKIIFAIILLIGWCAAIFNLSAMDSTDSNDASTSLVNSAIRKILIITNEHKITNAHLTDEQIDFAAQLVNAPLRKVMHASVYFILAILIIILACAFFGSKHYWIFCFFSLAGCFIFALTDEIHQTFVDGRTGQMMDVFIDTAGATAGVIAASSYYLAWRLGKHSMARDLHSNNNSKNDDDFDIKLE